MQKELIEKANKIISLIEENERAVEELQKYVETGKTLYADMDRYINCIGGFQKQ